MFSGYSPALLNNFCNKGKEFLDDITPWNMLQELLNHERYINFENWVQPSLQDITSTALN